MPIAAVALGLVAALIAFALIGEDEAAAKPGRPTPQPRPDDAEPPPGDAEPPCEQHPDALPDDPLFCPGMIGEYTCDELYNYAQDEEDDPDLLDEAARMLELAECSDLAQMIRDKADEIRLASVSTPSERAKIEAQCQAIFDNAIDADEPDEEAYNKLMALGCTSRAQQLSDFYLAKFG